MSDDRFHHHPYLQRVADEDVRYVLQKDASYGASWKKRGGVGAFMMLARKWDRLDNMLDGEAWKYDVFRAIQAQAEVESAEGKPQGSDGTVLAEVRDLRRYLLLVEAEMMARGVVAAPPPPDITELLPDPPPASVLPRHHLDAPTPAVKPPRAEQPGEGRRVPRFADDDTDSSRHASLTPWAVSMRWRYKHGMQPGGVREHVFDTWYCAVAPGTWVLEAAVAATVPAELVQCYVRARHLNADGSYYYTLDVEKLPQELRSYYPVLRREINAVEYGGLPLWQQHLYAWTDERTGNYVLQAPAWSAQLENLEDAAVG